jgi:putative membrane protein
MLRTRLVPALAAGFLALVLVSPAWAQSGGEAASDTPPAGDALTDANIAAIVVVANTADVENGELALQRSSNEAVKAFARTMVTDHTAVNEQAAKLVAKLGVTPQPGPASADLESATDAERRKIAALDGPAFDRAYVANEVAYHAAVLKTLDEALIPGAANPELKALLVAVRPAFVVHLEHAKKLQTDLEG